MVALPGVPGNSVGSEAGRNARSAAEQQYAEEQAKIKAEAEAAAQAAARRPLAAVERDAHAALLKAGFERIDYVAIRRTDDLGAFRTGVVEAPARILAAVWLGRTRLIDNMAVAAPA
jgi:pantothenate synthetase